MTIEEKIFSRMRFDAEAMDEYGFRDEHGCRLLTREFMGGDFTAEILVYESGTVRGRVIDNMNDEEYLPLRMENHTGAYVGSVRMAYEELLLDIAGKCCTEVDFASDQGNRIAAIIMDKYSVKPDFPWNDEKYKTAGVFRHSNSSRWFGLIMNIDRRLLDKGGEEEMVDVLNLKADESRIGDFRKTSGIYPAYHMNHKKWISIILDDTLTDDFIMGLVNDSYDLTNQGSRGVLNESLIKQVLSIADNIPVGKVMSYGQIAEAIGRPNNSRLVGKIMSMADRYGDHPCHRVVNHAGRTVPGWTEQRALLEAEGVTFQKNGCVDMKKHRALASDARGHLDIVIKTNIISIRQPL